MKMQGKVCVALLAAVMAVMASVSGCASRATAPQIAAGVVFSPPGWPRELAGDLYRPQACAPCPVIVLVHGGSWKSGSREQMHALAESLVKHGYAAFSVEYRLVPEARFPAQLDDVQRALRWIVDEGADWGLDADRIGIWGYSAGAQLAALAGLATESPRVRAVIAGGGPADMVYASTSPVVQALIGGTYEQMPEAYRAASPLHQVDADAPPMFVYHATWDWIVLGEHSRRLHAALQDAGVASELHWVPARGHIAAFLFPGETVPRAVAFLDRHLRDPAESPTP
jgi:acetyl esterase/lipase